MKQGLREMDDTAEGGTVSRQLFVFFFLGWGFKGLGFRGLRVWGLGFCGLGFRDSVSGFRGAGVSRGSGSRR